MDERRDHSYRLTEFTSHIYPAKLNEYLAMGLPVVSTPLPEVRRFVDRHGDVVAIAEDADGFCSAIARALGNLAPDRIERRLSCAQANDWAPRMAAMSEIVARALRPERPGVVAAALAGHASERA